MKKAEEMYQYCIKNKFGRGSSKSWNIKHFEIVENQLSPGEDVIMTFIGLHNYISMSKHDYNFAYAITNKRILMAQKKLIGVKFQAVLFDNLNDISLETGLMMGILTIDTIKERFNVGLDKKQAKNINDKIHEIIYELKNKSKQAITENGKDITKKQLSDLKELFDENLITLDEFEAKKKKILGI